MPNYVSKFTNKADGTSVDIELKDANARNLIAQEISDRSSADTTLKNSIDAEVTARKNADTTLKNSIDAEVTARKNADTTLKNSIDTEVTERKALISVDGTTASINKQIKYSKPTTYNSYFNSVKMTDTDGNQYDVLTAPDGGIDIKSVSERRFVFMADSYGSHHSTIDDKDHGWPREVISILGLTSENSYDSSVGSRGFVYNPAVGTFEQGLKSIISSITSPSTVTDLIVCGGTNDMVGIYNGSTTESAVKSAIQSFITYAKTVLPNATISIGFNGFVVGASYVDAYNKTVQAYRSATEYGANYITNLEYALANKTYQDDIHPTPTGFEMLDKAVIQAIYTGSCDIIVPPTVASLTMSDNVTLNLNTIYLTQHNEMLTVEQETAGIAFNVASASIKFSDLANGVLLCKVNNLAIKTKTGGDHAKTFFTGPMNIYASDGRSLSLPISYQFSTDSNGTWIKIRTLPTTSLTICYGEKDTTETTGYAPKAKSYSDVGITYIYIPQFTQTVPITTY